MLVDVTKIFAGTVKGHIITTNIYMNATTQIAEATIHQDMKIAHVNKLFAFIANFNNQTNSEIKFYQKLRRQRHKKPNMQHPDNKPCNKISIENYKQQQCSQQQ